MATKLMKSSALVAVFLFLGAGMTSRDDWYEDPTGEYGAGFEVNGYEVTMGHRSSIPDDRDIGEEYLNIRKRFYLQ